VKIRNLPSTKKVKSFNKIFIKNPLQFCCSQLISRKLIQHIDPPPLTALWVFFFFLGFMCLFERERAHTHRGRGRGRESSSGLPAEHGAHQGTGSHGPWDCDLSENQELDAWLAEPPRCPSQFYIFSGLWHSILGMEWMRCGERGKQTDTKGSTGFRVSRQRRERQKWEAGGQFRPRHNDCWLCSEKWSRAACGIPFYS